MSPLVESNSLSARRGECMKGFRATFTGVPEDLPARLLVAVPNFPGSAGQRKLSY